MCIEQGASADSTFGMGSPLDLQWHLAAGNRFTEAELVINREGRIAQTQIPRLLTQALRPFMRAAGVLCGSLLILLIAYSYFVLSQIIAPKSFLASVPRSLVAIAGMRLSRNAVLVAVIISLGAAASLVGAFFKSTETAFSLLLDLACGQAVCVEGRTSTSVDSVKGQGVEVGERVDRHYYVVQEQYMPVTLEAYEALRTYSGSTCRVYMAPRSKLLLSIEPVKVRMAR
jgi:hypothetical protein